MPPPPRTGPPVADTRGVSETCPGCGVVLASLPDDAPTHPGASASCARLFEVTVRGLREEAAADPSAASLVRLADAAYDAQHPSASDPDRLADALGHLAASLGTRPAGSLPGTPVGTPPRLWRTTIADAAADLDVIDLPVLVASWARSVDEDWTTSPSVRL